MREIKKLGFGLMRLPQKSDNATDIDMEQFKQMPRKATKNVCQF